MSKKELFVIIASVVLFVLLIALFVCEKKYPEGGVELLRTIMHGSAG